MPAAVQPLTELTRSGHPRLEVVDRSHGVDLALAEQAVADLLAALGQDPAAEPLLDTLRRVAASYAELVLTRAIPFASRGRRLHPDLSPAGLVRSDPRSRQESSLSPGSAGDGPHWSAAVK